MLPTVSRLVMADVTWAYCRFPLRAGPEEQVWNQYRNLLSGLLAIHEDDPGSPGAWILHDARPSDAEEAIKQHGKDDDPILAPYHWLLRQPRKVSWRSGAGPEQAITLITDGLRQCERVATCAWMAHQQKLLAAQMNLFACRMYLDPGWAMELAKRLIGQPDAPPCPIPKHIHICLGFRFQEHLGRYWLHATLSVWTYRPSSAEHAPPGKPGARQTSIFLPIRLPRSTIGTGR